MGAAPPRTAGLRLFRGLGIAASAVTYLVIVLGGIVRVSGSGMGCGDHWPLCHGSLLPPLDLPTIIEYGHRLVAATAGWLFLGAAIAAWLFLRARRELVWLATAALGLVIVQALLGAIA